MSLAALTPVVRAFLDERRFAVLATINESGLPQLTAIWYEVQGNEVMMNTALARRRAGVRRLQGAWIASPSGRLSL